MYRVLIGPRFREDPAGIQYSNMPRRGLSHIRTPQRAVSHILGSPPDHHFATSTRLHVVAGSIHTQYSDSRTFSAPHSPPSPLLARLVKKSSDSRMDTA